MYAVVVGVGTLNDVLGAVCGSPALPARRLLGSGVGTDPCLFPRTRPKKTKNRRSGSVLPVFFFDISYVPSFIIDEIALDVKKF